MPSKLYLRNFEAGRYYHLMHRAKASTTLFKSDADYQNFLLLLSYYLRFPDATPLSWVKRLTPQTVISKRNASQFGATPVGLVAFILFPDSFELIFKENLGGDNPGISNLMRRLSVGYAMHYNKTYGETGTIYHGKYKMRPLAQDSLSSAIDTLHHYPKTNDTYLSSPLHSSRPDYHGKPRPWLTLYQS